MGYRPWGHKETRLSTVPPPTPYISVMIQATCITCYCKEEREGREKGRKEGREEGTKKKSEVRSKRISLWRRKKLPSILLGSSDWPKD